MASVRELLRESLRFARLLATDSAATVSMFAASSILTYFGAMIMRDFIDSITMLEHYGRIFRLGLLLMGVTVTGYMLSFLGEYLLQRLGVKGIYIMSSRLMAGLHEAKLRMVRAGDVLARFVSDLPDLAAALAGTVPALAVQVVGFTVVIYTLGALSKELLLAALLLIPINYAVYKYSSGRIARYSRLERQGLSGMVEELKGNVDNLFFIKRTGTFHYFYRRFEQSLQSWVSSLARYLFYRIFFNKSYFYLNSLFRIIILLAGGILVIRGYTSVGAIIAFTQVLPNLYEPIMNIANMFTNLAAMTPYLERYRELENLEKEPLEGGKPLGRINRVVAENVTVEEDGKTLLRGVSLKLGRGEAIGVVGPIGSGKTTLALTLLRFHEPSRGRITINGEDYKEYSLKDLRRRIYYLPAREPILPATLAENLALGEDHPREELERAARAAGIDFATLDTGISQDNLSEGQKQKVALARAILRKPDILILDEATNSLDAEAEDQALTRLRRELPDTAIIIISHRLTALKHAEKIYVITDGRIVDHGTHQELIQRCEAYRRIVERHVAAR